MTTKANKFGLRAAAGERSSRHAQRTPLPPRAGVVESVREVQAFLVAVEAPDARSHTKAQTFAAMAATAGWSPTTAVRGGAVEVTALRGPEVIVQAWSGGVWQYEASVYAFADRTTKPRNASGAAKLLSRAPEAAQEETAKVNANSSFRKREPKELKTIDLPLDPELLTDEEATKYFRGRSVRWYNRQTRGTETATFSRLSPARVTRHDGEVTIWFCCPVTGFRAFHLSAVLAVGRGESAVTAGSLTAAVDLVAVDAA